MLHKNIWGTRFSVMRIPQSEQYVSSKLSEHISHFFSLMQHTNNKVIEVLIHPTQVEIKRFVRDLSGREMKSLRQNPFGCRATAGLTSLTWRPEHHKPAETAVVCITAETAPIQLIFHFPIAREHGFSTRGSNLSDVQRVINPLDWEPQLSSCWSSRAEWVRRIYFLQPPTLSQTY